MGDPKTWGGTETVSSMKKGDKDGLAGCLIDLNTLQEILYKRPSGKVGGMTFTHNLQSMLLADSNSVVGREIVLEQIRHTAKTAKRDPLTDKYINLYYTGHGGENTGNWVFKDGVITLQDVLDCFQQEEGLNKFAVTIYADCCYSGQWCEMLKEKKLQGKCDRIELKIWAAADYDQLGTEMVFSNLLKGQLPD